MLGFDEAMLDAIVAGVLARLNGNAPSPEEYSPNGARMVPPPVVALATPLAARAPAAGKSEQTTCKGVIPERQTPEKESSPAIKYIAQKVITEHVLREVAQGASAVAFEPQAVITPTGRDYLRNHNIAWTRSTVSQAENSDKRWAYVIVRNTPNIERLQTHGFFTGPIELFGCPDEAAAWSVAELTRGSIDGAFLFVTQVHRAACLANRSSAVKAVAVGSVREVVEIQQQLTANVWCISPSGRGYMELKNMLQRARS